MKNRQQFFGSLSILSAATIYGFFSILARFIGYQIPLFFQNWTRAMVASILLLFIITASKMKWKRLQSHEIVWIGFRALMGSAGFLLFYLAVNQIPVGTMYFIFYGGLIIVGYILGNIMYGEKMNMMKWLSMGLALIGLGSVYSLNFSHMPFTGMLMALTGGAATAFWNVLPKKLSHIPALQLTLLDSMLPIVWYMLLSLSTKEVWTAPDLSPLWIASLGYGALFVVTGQLVIYGFNRIDAQIGSILMLFEVPIAMFLSFLFYKEKIDTMTFFGGMLIFLAILIPEIALFIKKKKAHLSYSPL